MNVLIFPAGTELGREIYLSLQYCKDVNLYLGGDDYENQGMYYAEPYAILPSVKRDGWVGELNLWLDENKIDYIFPAHDEALLALVLKRDALAAHVLSCGLTCCEITRSKSATYNKLKDIIPTPYIYSKITDVTTWPVFLKPDKGQGANGTRLVHNIAELQSAIAGNKFGPLIICEYLPGDEFTIDCFSDRQSGLLFCQGRTRERIRNGIAMASQNVELEGIENYASAIARTLGLYGAWFFQVKRNTQGRLVLLEVAPRIAGTMALNRSLGVNFPLLTLYEHQRKKFTLMQISHSVRLSRRLVNKYRCEINYQHVYIDFDDTIIVRGKLCLPMINFLYQCLNENKNIHLITRHRGDIKSMLKKLRIYELFDEVIHITDSSRKSDYIKYKEAIFIDDSFSERQEVFDNTGIMTFDLSMIELLIK